MNKSEKIKKEAQMYKVLSFESSLVIMEYPELIRVSAATIAKFVPATAITVLPKY